MVEALEDLREFIAHRVREGFESAHENVENAHDWAYDKYERDDLLPEIKRLAAELPAAHLAKQAGWGPTTDCDRLDQAFATLNRQGIVARQDFSPFASSLDRRAVCRLEPAPLVRSGSFQCGHPSRRQRANRSRGRAERLPLRPYH